MKAESLLIIKEYPISFGFANGWQEVPELIKECRSKGHIVYKINDGRCITKRWCDICQYQYFVDSTG
jgi:hypothetical protein